MRHPTKPRHPSSQPAQNPVLQHKRGLNWTQRQLARAGHQEVQLGHHSLDPPQWHAAPADEATEVGWPSLPGNDAEAVTNCPPGECFLRVTAVLDTVGDDDADTQSCRAAADYCAQAAVPHACGNKPRLIGDGQHKVARNWHKVVSEVARLIWLSLRRVWALGHSLVKSVIAQSWLEQSHTDQQECQASLCICHSVRGLDRRLLMACIASAVDVVAAPYKQYMRELHALPSKHVIDSLAAEPHTSEALIFFTEFKDAHVPVVPNITMSDFRALSPRVVEFFVNSNGIAAFVALETNISGIFSNNGFLMLPWERRPVAFLAAEPLQGSFLESSLAFLSLLDSSLEM